jgi:hypothetical protein
LSLKKVRDPALGGGSDPLRQMVLLFTNFFQSAAGKVKAGPARSESTWWRSSIA